MVKTDVSQGELALAPENKLDYEDFKGKLGAWAEEFRPFIESKEMFDIMQRVKKDAFDEGVVPNHGSTFRAFETTNPKDIKVVAYLMDPYPRLYKTGKPQATGIAMDCSNSPEGRLQPSLEKWYDGISAELGKKVSYSPSLTYLHQQGVILLNTDLTCKVKKTGSHEGLWEPFQKYFLEEIMGKKTDIIYVLFGKAKATLNLEQYIQPLGNHIFKVEHPMAAAHMHREWETQGIFKKINRILSDNKQWTILWDENDWRLYSDPPF